MWEKVRLGDYIQLLGGGTPSKDVEAYWNGDIPWVSVKDFKEDHITSTQDLITIEGVKNSATRIIPADTLLIATRMAVGKVAINTVDVAINQDIKAITCNKELFPKFLFYFFKANEQHLQSLASGATVKGIKINHITDLAIPLPPIPVQQRIADILDKADALRRKDQELLKKYDQLAQAIFIDMFGDPVKNEKGWEVKPFEHFVTFDMKMTTDFDKHADLPHIGVRNIEKESGKLIGYKSVREEGLESGKYYFTDKHIIYSKIRPNLNKVALPNFHGLCSADSYPLLPTRNTNKVFFAFLLRSEHFLDFISGFSNRANIPKVNKSQLSKYEGISPPIELQNLFANKVKLINSMKGKINIADSEQLFHSLLYKSFNV